MPLRLVEALADGETRRIVDAIMSAELSSCRTWARDPLLDAWRAVLEPLCALDEGGAYVGTFRASVRYGAERVGQLPSHQREAGAMVILACTARYARTVADFAAGLRAARATGAIPHSELVRAALDAAVESSSGSGPDPVGLALPALVDLAPDLPQPLLRAHDVWLLRAALTRLGHEERADLQRSMTTLHADDQRLVEGVLSTPRHRRVRWPLIKR